MAEKKDWRKSPRDTNGPVVRNGPNGGQNRTRNKDGAWRGKRSDAGKSRKKSGCFVTTVVCQTRGLTDDCHELTVLRKFRDRELLATDRGRRLVEQYYSIAPEIAARLTSPALKKEVWASIQLCVSAIEMRNFEKAIAEYTRIISSLDSRLIRLEVATARTSMS